MQVDSIVQTAKDGETSPRPVLYHSFSYAPGTDRQNKHVSCRCVSFDIFDNLDPAAIAFSSRLLYTIEEVLRRAEALSGRKNTNQMFRRTAMKAKRTLAILLAALTLAASALVGCSGGGGRDTTAPADAAAPDTGGRHSGSAGDGAA